jgi:hypothetical protein
MEEPTLIDYVSLIFNLYERFVQESQTERSWSAERYRYEHKTLIVFFIMMQQRQIVKFKAMWRWLKAHARERQRLGFAGVPHRITLSRRYKALYDVLQAFIEFVGQYARQLDERFDSQDLYEDKSLFKACGPVWHQADREAQHIPPKLRALDTDASWSKSGYHGWVYGYSLHLTCNGVGFPKLVQVETGGYSEKQALAAKEPALWQRICPRTLTGDNSYAKAQRIRAWAKAGIALLTPAAKWVKGRAATAYHRFIRRPRQARLLRQRRTAIEPVFDLLALIIGAAGSQKQLLTQHLVTVRTCLALGVLTLQIAMLANRIWYLPLRSISSIGVALA